MAYFNASCQGLSTLCGFILPLCPGPISWAIVMKISCILYIFMFIRLRYREDRFERIERGKRLDEVEIYTRSFISLKLFRTCVVGWTFLVTMYFVFNFSCPLFAPEGSLLRHPAIPMISECFVDVVLKVFYMSLIMTLHEQVFDEGPRAKRRLEELRTMMWDNSSDVLGISVLSLSGIVTTMVSPTFFKMLREGKEPRDSLRAHDPPIGDRGMIFELPMSDLESLMDEQSRAITPVVRPRLYDFDFGGFSINDIKQKIQVSRDVTKLIGAEEIQALASLMARSWQCEKRDALLTHELVLRNDKLDLEAVHCEAKVTRLEESALFVVVRDISERFRRFEAEKKAVSEMTARQKDTEANRFTRHEVKNGLLAALGLSDSLTDTMKGAADSLAKLTAALGDDHAEEIAKLATVQDNISSIMTEMDSAIHDVLETILTEAMARDVIHGVYVPELEQVDIVSLLASMSRHTNAAIERFPVTSSPKPFPSFLFDPHLLKCIHRNAVSNAVKYGKPGGVVSTDLKYDTDSKILRMNVTNEPGANHHDIVKLGVEGAESVFSPGYRLHSKLGKGDEKSSVGRQSSGDGAWIMQKCAKTLGGECQIEFRMDQTVFSLRCPAVLFDNSLEANSHEVVKFKLPKGVWGIALDDSKMQRKLLKRILMLVGVSEDHVIVQGETGEEIHTFDDFMFDFIGSHPNDMFLLIVDENLDVEEEDISLKHSCISGSLLVQRLRYRLLPEQERQIVALVRSANDSSHDVAIYKARAHGFIPKAPIKKERITALIAPIWQERFDVLNKEQSLTTSLHSQSTLATCLSDRNDDYSNLMEHIRKVDEIIDNQEYDISEQWPEIWQKLHAFKGDLLSLRESEDVAVVVQLINAMRGRNLPVNFLLRWEDLRDVAVKLDVDDDSLSEGDELG